MRELGPGPEDLERLHGRFFEVPLVEGLSPGGRRFMVLSRY